MKKLYLFAVVSLVFIVASCHKDAAVKPVALPAVNSSSLADIELVGGNVMYISTTTPTSSIGTTGDYFLDLTTELIYGPKTSPTAWPIKGYSFKGETGPTGATGATGSTGATGPLVQQGLQAHLVR
jgi:hypothetical protein